MDIGWPTGNRKILSNCPACCLAQLCLAAAMFLSIACGQAVVTKFPAEFVKLAGSIINSLECFKFFVARYGQAGRE